MELSIVIIARNEEATIGRNLENIVQEIRGRDAEIILVNSASTDKTAEIARTFPVRIITVEKSPLLSPAAGRYLGTIHSRGNFVFFLDGDMILIPGWLEKGLAEMRDGSLAGIAGRIYYVLPGEELSFDHPDGFPLGDILGIGLSAIYRRDVLSRNGTFNPYIKGEEEVELGYRIITGGFGLKRIEVPMAYHVDKAVGVGQIDQKAKYFAGTGQILRKYPFTWLSGRLVRGTAPVFAQQAVFWGTIGVFLVALLGGWFTAAAVVAGIAVAGLGALTVWKGPAKIVLYLRSIVLITYHMARGYLKGLPDGRGFESKVRFTIHEPRG